MPAIHFSHTSLEKLLLFDYPAYFSDMDAIVAEYPLKDISDVQEIPSSVKTALDQTQRRSSWRGLYPFFLSLKKKGWQEAAHIFLFEKIRQGQIWRLFTPCLLHYDFLHILFNMAWLWILGRQIEDRIHWWKMGI